MSGLGKDVSGMVGISQDEVGAGTFPDNICVILAGAQLLVCKVIPQCLEGMLPASQSMAPSNSILGV